MYPLYEQHAQRAVKGDVPDGGEKARQLDGGGNSAQRQNAERENVEHTEQGRDGKAEQILSTMQTNAGMGMITMNQALGDLYIQKKISYQEALSHSGDPSGLKTYLQQKLGTANFR